MINLNFQTIDELGVTNPKITCQSDLRFYSVKQEPFTIYGLYEPLGGSPYHRMPESVAEAVNDGVKLSNFCTAGGRVRFVTDSDYIALRMISGGSAHMSNMCLNASSAFDIYVSRNGTDRFAGVFDPTAHRIHGRVRRYHRSAMAAEGAQGGHDKLSTVLRRYRALDRA